MGFFRQGRYEPRGQLICESVTESGTEGSRYSLDSHLRQDITDDEECCWNRKEKQANCRRCVREIEENEEAATDNDAKHGEDCDSVLAVTEGDGVSDSVNDPQSLDKAHEESAYQEGRYSVANWFTPDEL